jgi:hypothetical protein
LTKFYHELVNARDYSVLDELFIPEGKTKEQFIAENRAKLRTSVDSTLRKRAALRLRGDSIRKTIPERRRSDAQIDSIFREKRALRGDSAIHGRRLSDEQIAELITDVAAKANDFIIREKKPQRSLRVDSIRQSFHERHNEQQIKIIKEYLLLDDNRIAREKIVREKNQELLEKEKEFKKYLTVDKKTGHLKAKGKIKYEKIINNSEFSVRKRKEIIAFLYYVERGAKGKSIKIDQGKRQLY